VELENTTVPVGCETQLLIDDYVVDDIWRIRRSPELPDKHLNSPVFTGAAPFEEFGVSASQVIYGEEEKVFKLWYTVMDTNQDTLPPGVTRYMYRSAYAVSDDGINWEAPDLGVVEYRGSKRNNLVMADGVAPVFNDPHEQDPERRYKVLTKRKKSRNGRVSAAFSPDGIHWNDYPSEESVLRNSGDGSNGVVYDPKIGRYVLFCRPTILAAQKDVIPEEIGFPDDRVYRPSDPSGKLRDAPKGTGFPSEEDYVDQAEAEDYVHRYLKSPSYIHTKALRMFVKSPVGSNRRIARSESTDFIHWSEPAVVIRPDELDPPSLYNMKVMLYRGMYIGMLEVFYQWGNRRFPGCPQEPETFDLQLAFSRDGKRWERLANRPVFLPRGYIGSFDGGMIQGCSIVEYEDELRIYYTGNAGCHNAGLGKPGLGVARLPKERFVARTAGDELGVLMTKPFVVEGDRIEINADARRGLMKIEITNPIGEPLEGFNVRDSAEIAQNEFSLPVEWSSGKSPGDLKGQTVRLRFYMHQAKLYSFRLSSSSACGAESTQ